MDATVVAPILRTQKSKYKVDLAVAMAAATAEPGQSYPRLIWRILRCKGSVQRLSPAEFFRYGLYRTSSSDAECRMFLSDPAMWAFNSLLNGPPETNQTDTLRDKLATNAILEAAGIPVAREHGTFHPATGTLRSVADITAFLLAPGNLPLFGKPVHARNTIGAVAVEEAQGDGFLRLGDGRIVAAGQLAAEIATHYREGYVFQELLRAGDAIRPLSGPVVPTLRMATIRVGGTPIPLYAALRLPAVGAMADGDGVGENARLYLDIGTGAVIRGQNMSRFGGTDLDKAPVTGLPLKGVTVPDWPAILRLSVDIHHQFPRHTFVGSDIALASRGLVVNEANAHPQHMGYQMASAKGILNDAFRPVFREVLAEKGITAPPPNVAWPYV